MKYYLLSIFFNLIIIADFEESNHLILLNKYKENCETLLEEYANTIFNFTKCVIQHVQPITVCQKCVTKYAEVRRSHKLITKLRKNAGETCRMELINVDRLEVIEGSFNFVVTQWEKASCKKCFKKIDNAFNLNPTTNSIIKLYNKTEKCINSFEKVGPHNASLMVCEKCINNYLSLNIFYNSHGSYDGFCLDVVDMMYTIRSMWGKRGCYVDQIKPDVIFIIGASTACIIPFIFYILLRYCSNVSFLEIANQNRWIHRFHRLSISSTS